MSVTIPPILVLIVCKTALLAGPPDPNASYTHYENREWATEHSMMVCRRHEVQLYDPAEDQKVSPKDDPTTPLNPDFTDAVQCARAGMSLQMAWDQQHQSGPWRVWRVGCPAKIIDKRTGAVVGYKLPECGHADTVVCEVDSAI